MSNRFKNIGWKANIVILAVATLLTLVSLEFMLRYNDYKRKEDYRENVWTYIDDLVMPAENPNLIYKMRPGFSDGNIFFDEINQHGYRDYEHSYEKPEDTFRIVMIGDSVTYGYILPLQDTFSAKIQWLLNENPPNEDLTYEVIILAQPSYSISQYYTLLEDEAFEYDPDLIVWNYVLNDPAHPYLHDSFGSIATYVYEPNIYVFDLINRIGFYTNERIKASRLDCPLSDDFVGYIHCVYWDKVESYTDKVSKIQEENGVPIVMAIHPMYAKYEGELEDSFFDDYSYKYIHQDLKILFKKNGLKTIDLYDDFEDDLPSVVAFDQVHPNQNGNKIISDSMIYFFKQNDLLSAE